MSPFHYLFCVPGVGGGVATPPPSCPLLEGIGFLEGEGEGGGGEVGLLLAFDISNSFQDYRYNFICT